MAAPVRTLCCSALRLSSRHFSSTCGVQAGQKWRTEHGLSRSGTEYGPLTDLPDWSFEVILNPHEKKLEAEKKLENGENANFNRLQPVDDGRPAPPLKGQLRRRKEKEELARRIVMLNSEVDRGIEVWEEKQQEAKRMEEHKQSLLLKPKGKLLIKKPRS